MCLHMQLRKLSLLGIAVAGVYCCMGLRSVLISPRSSLLLGSDPSIGSFNWQGSLVIRLAAIVSINGLSRKIIIALIGNTVHAHSFFCFITASWRYHNQIWTSGIFFFEIWKVLDLTLTDLNPNCEQWIRKIKEYSPDIVERLEGLGKLERRNTRGKWSRRGSKASLCKSWLCVKACCVHKFLFVKVCLYK